MRKYVNADSFEYLDKIEENTVDGLVTDPPYGIAFMNKQWDHFDDKKKYQLWTEKYAKKLRKVMKPGAWGLVFGGTRMYHRAAVGLEDAGFEIKDTLMWLYTKKIIFCRQNVSGFPKGQNIARAIDKHKGIEPAKGPMKIAPDGQSYDKRQIDGHPKTKDVYGESPVDPDVDWYHFRPTSDEAKQWYGYRTGIKPAWEPIILIQNPREGTYVENILKWKVGGINIDECRIPINLENEDDPRVFDQSKNFKVTNPKSGGATAFWKKDADSERSKYINQAYDMKGRYPTNVVIDEFIAAVMNIVKSYDSGKVTLSRDVNRKKPDPDGKAIWNKETAGFWKGGAHKKGVSTFGDGGGLSRSFYTCPTTDTVYDGSNWERSVEHYNLKDGGGLGKFFYCPKAHTNERNLGLENKKTKKRRDTSREGNPDNPYNRNDPKKNSHPTCKPIKLITYLIRLIKPPIENPLILDPFGGTATTAIAAKIEQCDYIVIEKNVEYHRIGEMRLNVPMVEYQKYSDSVVHPDDENQTRIDKFQNWL